MTNTANLQLPEISDSQSLKHITHNEALKALDVVVQLAVKDRDLTAPPASPSEGGRYIVAGTATGDWVGEENNIAAYQDGAWVFYTPKAGWQAWVEDEAILLVWKGAPTYWADLVAGGGYLTLAMLGNGTVVRVGVNTAADANNRLAAKTNAVLLSHDDVTPGTGDMRVTLNKSAAGKDVGFVFQDGYSTRALLGLLADDDFWLKVSPDGSTFATALIAKKDSGQIDMPMAPKFAAYINYDQYVAANTWTKIGINNARHNDQAAFDAANNRFVAPADGTYLFGAKYRFKANATVPTSIRIGFGKNNAAPAAGDDECTMQGPIVTLVSSVQHVMLYKLALNDTIDVRAFMATNDGYCESGAVSFWGHRVA